MAKLVHGQGINDIGGLDNENLKIAYSSWKEMLRRCYSKKFLETNKTYEKCNVSDEWMYFSNFLKFFNEEYKEGSQLDKDILIKGNKLYSKNTCCFVPPKINSIIETSKKIRGKHLIGVYYDKSKNKFRAFCSIDNKAKCLGNFDTEIDAFYCYKTFKENHIKEIAKNYYKNNMISEKIYNALLNWEINIED